MGESNICKYYKDKHVLVTGATGLVGKLLVEKLLRVCKPAKIYLIIRNKRSNDPFHRFKELTETPVFQEMKKENPDFMKSIAIIFGDFTADGLGLSLTDVELLVEKVQVVFHGAATVKFNENLDIATKINVLGTKMVLELCKKMKHLEAIVHISTAYSQSPVKEIKEIFYETPLSPEELIGLTKSCGPSEINNLTPSIIGKWKNTYVFTKALAEEIVKKNSKGLPIAIFRPGIILTTRNEPIPNWIDNFYGPMGIVCGSIIGAIRVIRLKKKVKGEFMPADMTINCLLAIGYEAAKSQCNDEIIIYNFTSHPDNPATWGDLVQCMTKRANEIPSSRTFWHYSYIITAGKRSHFYFVAFFLHILPAILIDIGLIAFCKKPRALGLYKKIHDSMDLLGHFSTNTWKFSIDNTINLWNSLSAEDKKLFDFNMASINYESYLSGSTDGAMIHLLKESNDEMDYRKKRYFFLYSLYLIIHFIMYCGAIWIVWKMIN